MIDCTATMFMPWRICSTSVYGSAAHDICLFYLDALGLHRDPSELHAEYCTFQPLFTRQVARTELTPLAVLGPSGSSHDARAQAHENLTGTCQPPPVQPLRLPYILARC